MAKHVKNPYKNEFSDSSAAGNFPIVGIGASAGGLESIKKLFSIEMDDLGMAYIVVVHMMPDQPSLMPDILQNHVSIPVKPLKQGDRIKPDHIYIAPAGRSIWFRDDRIELSALATTRPSNQIDLFFTGLADHRQSKAVGVILSGTGSDGSVGIKSIKENNGLVIVESQASAAYDGMPRSAADTGLADLIVDADQILNRLIQFFSPNGNGCPGMVEGEPKEKPLWLTRIYSILKARTGHNFSNYKTNTILRRISRRMSLSQIDTPNEYLTLLKDSPQEVESLFNELLIGVTSFFRDPESFETFRKKALLKSLGNKQNDQTYRIWVPGCSTGEEVYSLAMLLKENLDEMDTRINLQIFGTDIDKIAIEKAREAVYPESIASEISPQRLKRFFHKEGPFYKIRNEIRECAIFSIQDVIKDPPFSRLDLVCCRNLLIYLNPAAQKKILPLFHYTLLPDGILILGASETIGSFSNLFATVDNKWKIFRRREIPRSLIHQVEFPSGMTSQTSGIAKPAPDVKTAPANIATLAQQAILERYAPTSLIVDEKGNILYVQGRTGKYLETTSGAPSFNILDLAREGLRIELSSALREASKSKEMIVRKGIEVKTNGDFQAINLKVNKIYSPKGISGRLLVAFEDIETPPETADEHQSTDLRYSEGEKSRIFDLEKELQNTRESHQVTIEELESSNEELKSTNEELQSSNEELQSTNEELESSKEEMQSLNEELQTVNSELQSKVEELSGAQDDMRNLLNSTQIATVFVDNHLNVKRFTSESSKIVNLIQTDIGRPLKHIVNHLNHDGFLTDIESVLNDLSTLEKEVQTKDDQWFNMRIMPYRTTDNRIQGAVITFADISEQKRTTDKMENAWQLTRNVFDLNKNPLAVVDIYGRVVIANTEFSTLIQSSPGIVEGTDLTKLKDDILDNQVFREIIKATQKSCDTIEFPGSTLIPGGPRYLVRTQRVLKESKEEPFILLECLKM